MIKLLETRLAYLELTRSSLENESIADISNMSLIDAASIPNLETIGQDLRAKYLK